MNKQPIISYRVIGIILICSSVILLYSIKPSFIERLALGVEDNKYLSRAAFGLAQTPHEDVLLIEIDEQSINKYGRWPWPRDLIANLLETLRSADTVVLDIVFSEPGEKAHDQELINQVEDQGNVILGYFLRQFATQGQTEVAQDALEECAYINVEQLSIITGLREFPFVEANITELAEVAMSCAVFSTEPDLDGMFRRYPLAYVHKGFIFPPLAVQAVRYGRNTEADIQLDKFGLKKFIWGDIEISNHNYLRLSFPQYIRRISARSLLDGTVNVDFGEKIVLIGLTEMGIYDMRPTPIDPITPGVYLHYAATSNLLSERIVIENNTINYLYFAIAFLFAFLSGRNKSLTKRLFLYAASFSILLLASHLLYWYFELWLREFHALLLLFLLMVFLESEYFLRTELYASQIKAAFSNYVSPALVDRISENRDNLKLGGDEKKITVLFADLRQFTNIAEQLTPGEVVALLNEIFDPLTRIVLENEGMLDKYMGDALMAIFNAPIDIQDQQYKACNAAHQMLLKIESINRTRLAKGNKAIHLGIGINTGLAVVGNMGSALRFSYTALGDAVNLASRIESLTKYYGCSCLITQETYDWLPIDIKNSYRFVDEIYVLGRNTSVALYSQIFKFSEQDDYMKAYYLYKKGDFVDAKLIWKTLAIKDKISLSMVHRCDELISQKSNDDFRKIWSGIYKFDKK